MSAHLSTVIRLAPRRAVAISRSQMQEFTLSAKAQRPSYRILIVDDNPGIHEDFRKILTTDQADKHHRSLDELEAAFFNEAHTANDADFPGLVPTVDMQFASQGQEALRWVADSVAEDRRFDMAFVDMRMPPGWDGLETIEQLWKVDPGMQVVICTAFADHSWVEILDRLDQPDNLLILRKPFDSAEVAQMAFTMARKRQLEAIASTRLQDTENLVQLRTRDLQVAKRESDRLIESISSIVIQLDGSGVVSRWNSTAADVFSIPRDLAVGKPVEHLPIDWMEPERSLEFFHQGGAEGPVREELVFQTDDNSQRIVAMTSYPVTDDEDCLTTDCGERRSDEAIASIEGFLILGVDLTEQKRLQQQLSAAQKLEAVGQLAAGVAHEINTPMQYVGDNINYVKSSFDKIIAVLDDCRAWLATAEELNLEVPGELADKLKSKRFDKLKRQIPEALQDSEEGVAHVSRIVRAMKQFSHPGEQTATEVSLNDALETTIAVATNEWKYVAEVKTDFDPNLPAVTGFPCELNQVFLNLIVNAAHAIAEKNGEASTEKGEILVRTTAADGFVEVHIGDTGAGIPEAVRGRIFDPFFTTKGVGKGTGQGLSIAYQVITQTHHGEIDFNTQLGVGTTFILRLPLKEVKSGEKMIAPGVDCSTNYSRSIMSLDSIG